MSLEGLTGRSYGPFSLDVAPRAIAGFVAATADDPARWQSHAPPGFAAAALFAVAPALLGDEIVKPVTRSVVHADQAFEWHGPLRVGEVLSVEGRVEGIRARGALNVVTFRVGAQADGVPWISSRSTFLLSAQAAAAADDESEPHHDARGPCDPATPLDLPSPGEAISPMRRSASRGDLIRYAGATGDWNPIHWDHDAARAVGLPGVVVHGLLLTAWLAQAAARYGGGPVPVAALRARFRAPLRPAADAEIVGRVTGTGAEDARMDLEMRSGGVRLITAEATVTR